MMCENHTPVQGLLHHTLFPYCVDRHSLSECQQEYAICRLVASVLIRYLWVTPFAFSLDLKWRFGGEDPFPSSGRLYRVDGADVAQEMERN